MGELLRLLLLGASAYVAWQALTQNPADGDDAVSAGAVDAPDGAQGAAVPNFNDTLDTRTLYVEDPRIAAFLLTIRASEVGYLVPDSTRYATYYGGSTFSNFSDHPAVTGEKQGVPLPPSFCQAAGLSPGCVSTAAGAYQINKPTWLDVRQDKGDGYGYLADFSAANQDIAALRLLRATGALNSLAADNTDLAYQQASTRWASLPGSTAKQGGNSLATLTAWFNAALSGTA